MLDGIVMDVIDMVFKIPFIPNAMLPKSSLPYSLFLFMAPTGNNIGTLFAADGGGKRPFDIAPTHGIIGIARRQCPYGVNMIGQNNNGIDMKRTARPFVTKRRPQLLNVFGLGK